MRKLLWMIAVWCLLLTACGEGPSAETTVPQRQTRTVYVRTASTTQTDGTITRTEYLFDEADRVTEVVIRTGDTETQRYRVECDENGNYIRWTCGGSQIRYRYDDAGHLTRYAVYTGDELISATEYIWEGELRTSVIQSMPGQGLEHRTDMIYNEAGTLIRQDIYRAGVLENYEIYTLGEDGKAQSVTTYLANGTASETVHFQYGEGTVTMTAEDGTWTRQCYDGNGNLLSTTNYAADGTQLYQQTHSYKAIEVDVDCPRAAI